MSRPARPALLLTVCALIAVACGGHAVVVEGSAQRGPVTGEAAGPAVATSRGEPGDAGAGQVGGGGGVGGPGSNPVSGAPGSGDGEGGAGGRAPGGGRCATNANPAEGFTADTIKIGTILPLSGALRPIGEQLARVMRVMMEEWLPENDFIPGPLEHLNWDCPQRPGIFGRTVELEIFSLQANTPEEALAGMRRLIDVEKVFLVRDCTLTDSLMGPATQYQNSKGVPAIYCHFGGMPVPALEKWNFNPGIDPLVQAAIHIGYLIKKLGRQRIAILADVNDTNIIDTVRRVAAHLGRPIPDRCVVTSRSQEASAGMASQVAAIRTCYPTGPDAVFAGDGLQAVFGALEAKRQGWRGADVGVQWACTNPTCWAEVLGEICGDACQGMLTDCASLPCVPWADPDKYPAVANLVRWHRTYLPGEPADAATYGTISIGSGISYFLTMTGPDLSREKFRQTMETKIRNFDSGIGPVLNIGPTNHYGGRAQWLIRFTGRPPWFADETGDFVAIDSLGIPTSVVYG